MDVLSREKKEQKSLILPNTYITFKAYWTIRVNDNTEWYIPKERNTHHATRSVKLIKCGNRLYKCDNLNKFTTKKIHKYNRLLYY